MIRLADFIANSDRSDPKVVEDSPDIIAVDADPTDKVKLHSLEDTTMKFAGIENISELLKKPLQVNKTTPTYTEELPDVTVEDILVVNGGNPLSNEIVTEPEINSSFDLYSDTAKIQPDHAYNGKNINTFAGVTNLDHLLRKAYWAETVQGCTKIALEVSPENELREKLLKYIEKDEQKYRGKIRKYKSELERIKEMKKQLLNGASFDEVNRGLLEPEIENPNEDERNERLEDNPLKELSEQEVQDRYNKDLWKNNQ